MPQKKKSLIGKKETVLEKKREKFLDMRIGLKDSQSANSQYNMVRGV